MSNFNSHSMNNFSTHKYQKGKSMVSKPFQHEINKPPRQFCDYMNGVDNRFSEICRLYLDGMSMDDVKYLTPDDLVALVPKEQYRHRMLMTIMVRRYLYRIDDCTDNCLNHNDCHCDTHHDTHSVDSYKCNNRNQNAYSHYDSMSMDSICSVCNKSNDTKLNDTKSNDNTEV